MKKGFSLVELSIVLAIIGLLIGAIMGASELLVHAELRSISQDISKYRSAINFFKAKYNYLPGDMPNANDYWSGCGDGTSAANCNGNGDELVTWSADLNNETYRAWQHMSLAQIIEGDYKVNTSNVTEATLGYTVPEATINGSGFNLRTFATKGNASANYPLEGLALSVGILSANSSWPDYAILTPQEAYILDNKMDDGKADSGEVMPNYYYDDPSWQTTTCLDGTFPNRTFELSDNTNKECIIYFSAE